MGIHPSVFLLLRSSGSNPTFVNKARVVMLWPSSSDDEGDDDDDVADDDTARGMRSTLPSVGTALTTSSGDIRFSSVIPSSSSAAAAASLVPVESITRSCEGSMTFAPGSSVPLGSPPCSSNCRSVALIGWVSSILIAATSVPVSTVGDEDADNEDEDDDDAAAAATAETVDDIVAIRIA